MSFPMPPMHHALALAFLLSACLHAPPAQRLSGDASGEAAARYLPAGYEGELFVDWAAMREIGLLDRVLRLPMAEQTLDMLATSHGFRLDDVARERTAFMSIKDGRGAVSVAELDAGAERVDPPAQWEPVQIGSHRGYRHDASANAEVTCWPAANIAITGPAALLEELLDDRAPGGPHPELAQMLAPLGGERVLAQCAYGRFGHPYDDVLRTFGRWFGDQDDPVDFVRLRLSRDAGEAIAFSITFRFQNGTSGLRSTEEMVRGQIAAWLEDERFAAFESICRAIVVSHRERDLCASLVLGSPRAAVRTVENLVIALMAHMQNERRR